MSARSTDTRCSWALLAAVLLEWFINREVGRYAAVTGAPILEGLVRLRGPKGRAIWVLLVPQFVVAVSLIAGLASAAATATVLLVLGPMWLWTAVLLIGASALVIFGPWVGFALSGAAGMTWYSHWLVAKLLSTVPGIGDRLRGCASS